MGQEEASSGSVAAFVRPIERLLASRQARQRYDGGVLLICLAGATLGRTPVERLAFLGVYVAYTFVMGIVDAVREARARRVLGTQAEQTRLTGDEESDAVVSTE